MSLPQREGVELVALTDQSMAAPGMVMKSDLLPRPFPHASTTLSLNSPEDGPRNRLPVGAPAVLADGEDLAPADRLFLLQLQRTSEITEILLRPMQKS